MRWNMAAINMRRVLLGAVVGGMVWSVWSLVVNVLLASSAYASAQDAELLLKDPRYRLFMLYWIITLFVLSYILAWLYASVRATCGPGAKTALKVGVLVGFAAGFPVNLSVAAWVPVSRIIPLWWTLDLWVGAILAAVVAGWLYKDKP